MMLQTAAAPLSRIATVVLSAAALIMAGLFVGAARAADTETAIFAGGCFWCVESDFDHVTGVISTTSGYIGGTNDNPTYRNHDRYKHREAVKIVFDPAKTSYQRLAHIFFRSIDPLDAGGQFCDRGHSYTSAIYALNEAQTRIARQAKAAAAAALGKQIVTEIEGPARFWPAEDYHQNYYKGQNIVLSRFGPVRQSEAYKGYRSGCGRDARIRAVWGAQAHECIAAHD